MDLGLSLRQVAEISSSWISMVSKYERGEVLPKSPLVVEGLARALGIDAAELAGLVAVDRRVRKTLAEKARRSPKAQFANLAPIRK